MAGWIPYCGVAPVPGGLMERWNLDPLLLAVLAGAAAWCWMHAASRRRVLLAFAVLLLVFVSPLCALSSALFAARVAHHVLLTAVAAPLLVWAFARVRVPGGAALWAAVHALTFWLWHSPGVYAAALSSDALYWLMQLTLFGSALGLWASVRAAPVPLAVAALLGTMVQMGLLGALITFAGAPLYAPHWLTTIAWGLSPLEDQQLAGLIMWAPASGLYLAAAMLLGWRGLGEDRRVAA